MTSARPTDKRPRRITVDNVRPEPETPSALEYYRALRQDGGDPGKRIKAILEALIRDPGEVRAHSRRYRPGDWWAAETEMPNGAVWWVVWRERNTEEIHIRYIGPAPA